MVVLGFCRDEAQQNLPATGGLRVTGIRVVCVGWGILLFGEPPNSTARQRARQRAMGYQPIENYGIIGNMRTVALVGMNGSIDWYCSPNFDSPSIFGAILDDAKGGRFQIQPIAQGIRHKQFYWPSTNILVTRFSLEDGIAEIQDFMPI